MRFFKLTPAGFLSKGNMYTFKKTFMALAGPLILLLLTSCGTSGNAKTSPGASYPNPLPAYPNPGCAGQACPEADANVTISGWVSIVQNGHTVYTLFDDQGAPWELLIDETLLQSVGGAQALNGKRVLVDGTWTSDTPAKIRVSSLQIEE